MFATELYAIYKQCHETIVCGVMRLVGMHQVAEGIRADGEMHVTGPILAHSGTKPSLFFFLARLYAGFVYSVSSHRLLYKVNIGIIRAILLEASCFSR